MDKVIERILKSNKKWGARDRGFIAESTYEIVRWWRFLWAVNGREPSLKTNDLYRLFGIWWLSQSQRLPAWDEFNSLKDFNIQKALENVPEELGIQQSYPEWLDQLAANDLGQDDWQKVATNMNLQAAVMLRVNTLLISRDSLQESLQKEGFDTQHITSSSTGLILEKRANIFRSNAFKKGYFEVQDGGSQLIAPFLKVKPGMRVIDACAGAGGKTLHLAMLMENKGSIIAMDVEKRKLSELRQRARRSQVHNVETRLIHSSKVIKRLANTADRLLLDVPCSGTGVIKRNPDTKWKLTPEYLDKLRALQSRIIREYSEMLKPGGLMVYATCSILKSESEDQVAGFLADNQNFKLHEQCRVDPGPESDGFYLALLEKC